LARTKPLGSRRKATKGATLQVEKACWGHDHHTRHWCSHKRNLVVEK
jgi:hypothetical protein